MTLYNALVRPLTTMPTGGFSPEADSIAAFSAAVQWVVIPFVVAAGTNFALFWRVIAGEPRRPVADTEFRGYLGILGVVGAVLAGLLGTVPGAGPTSVRRRISDPSSRARSSRRCDTRPSGPSRSSRLRGTPPATSPSGAPRRGTSS